MGRDGKEGGAREFQVRRHAGSGRGMFSLGGGEDGGHATEGVCR